MRNEGRKEEKGERKREIGDKNREIGVRRKRCVVGERDSAIVEYVCMERGGALGVRGVYGRRGSMVIRRQRRRSTETTVGTL